MTSYKQRLIALHTGASNEVAGVMQYTGFTPVLAKNLELNPLEGDYQALDQATGFEGAQGEELYNAHTRAKFEVEAAGSGVAGTAPAFDTLMKACGMDATVVVGTSVSYAPTPTDGTHAEQVLQMRNSRLSQIMEGARGSLMFSAEANRKPHFGFTMLGAFRDPDAAVAVGAIDFTTWKEALECTPPNIAAFTWGGQTLCLQSFNVTDGRQPTRGKFMNCGETDITGRNITGRMTIEWPATADLDIIDKAKSGETAPLVFEIGKEAGKTLRVAGPAVQLKYAGEQDINGTLGVNIDLVFQNDQGDDEIAFIFT